jgi:hypothetical protein
MVNVSHFYQKPESACYFFRPDLTRIEIPCNGLLITPGRFIFGQDRDRFCNGNLGLNVGVVFDLAYTLDLCAPGTLSPVTFSGNWNVGGGLGCNGAVDVTLAFNYANPLP